MIVIEPLLGNAAAATPLPLPPRIRCRRRRSFAAAPHDAICRRLLRSAMPPPRHASAYDAALRQALASEAFAARLAVFSQLADEVQRVRVSAGGRAPDFEKAAAGRLQPLTAVMLTLLLDATPR